MLYVCTTYQQISQQSLTGCKPMSNLFKSGSSVRGIWKVYITHPVDDYILTEFLFDKKIDAVKLYAYMCIYAHLLDEVDGEVHIKEVHVYTTPNFAFNLETHQIPGSLD